jgi:CheY-like chemotaxis protein
MVKDRRNSNKCPQPLCKGFKLIFMDFSMPVMNGFECTRKIRKFEKANS